MAICSRTHDFKKKNNKTNGLKNVEYEFDLIVMGIITEKSYILSYKPLYIFCFSVTGNFT